MACVEIPDLRGFRAVRDDYTAGFAAGVEAVRDWLMSMPPSGPQTSNDLGSLLDDMIELRRG